MNRSVLITGADQGIGQATLRHTAALGFRVIGTGRTAEDVDAIEATARETGHRITAARLDVTDADGCARVIDEHRPDALVNNAGYFNAGAVEDVEDQAAREQLETMVVAPLRLARLALPHMRQRGWGRILNVTSAMIHVSLPMAGWYAASKSSLAMLTTTLRTECRRDGIDVIAIEPASVDTAIWDRAEHDLEHRAAGSTLSQAYDRTLALLRRFRGGTRGPEHVADAIGRALTDTSPRPRYRIGLDGTVLRWSNRLAPPRLHDRVARAVLGLSRT